MLASPLDPRGTFREPYGPADALIVAVLKQKEGDEGDEWLLELQ